MALLYRAVWNDDHPGLGAHAAGVFAAWLGSKGLDDRLPIEGTVERSGGDRVAVRRANVDRVEGIRLELTRPATESRAQETTTLVALTDERGDGWLWTDVAEAAASSVARRLVPAPNLVLMLLDAGVGARVDQVRLTTKVPAVLGQAVAGLVRNTARSLPLIVFSHDEAFDVATTMGRATTTLRALAGAAQVFVLPPGEDDALRAALGDELAVGHGAARLYLPNQGVYGLRPDRHRVIEASRLGFHESIPARIFAGLLATVITARQPPPGFDQIRRQLHGGDGAAADVRFADAEIARLRAERDDLRVQLARLEEDLFDTQADLLATEEELSGASIELKHLWGTGARPVAASSEVEAGSIIPATVRGAVDLARLHLSGLAIHAAACRDVDDLDAHPNGPAWAASTWRGLRALDTYARAGYDGNFKQWCLHSGDPWAWPGSDKKLAMRESETVQTNDRLRRQRLLPVDPQVDPSGAVHMWAHLKVAEGGGPIAPRVYFHDDTRGSTGKVHIGFIGPHRHMENTKTN